MINQVEPVRSSAAQGEVKIVLIDFHTHTSASDGALDPCELVARALANKVDLLAITDHDTVAGYEAAAAYHRPVPGRYAAHSRD